MMSTLFAVIVVLQLLVGLLLMDHSPWITFAILVVAAINGGLLLYAICTGRWP